MLSVAEQINFGNILLLGDLNCFRHKRKQWLVSGAEGLGCKNLHGQFKINNSNDKTFFLVNCHLWFDIKCTALKATCLLSVWQMKIVSLRMTQKQMQFGREVQAKTLDLFLSCATLNDHASAWSKVVTIEMTILFSTSSEPHFATTNNGAERKNPCSVWLSMFLALGQNNRYNELRHWSCVVRGVNPLWSHCHSVGMTCSHNARDFGIPLQESVWANPQVELQTLTSMGNSVHCRHVVETTRQDWSNKSTPWNTGRRLENDCIC